MEVHHHGHMHHEKKWKEYVFQFFMLFLAVFCGTLAEYWLEHRIEHNREKEYMASLVADLQSDTAEINTSMTLGGSVIRKADTLVGILNVTPIPASDVPRVYRLSAESSRVFDVRFEDRTSSQLKNSGSMRLVRNQQVADSIRKYWSHIIVLQSIAARLEYMGERGNEFSVQIFQSKYYGERDPNNPLKSPPVKPNAQLLTTDPKILAAYTNWKYYRRAVSMNYVKHLHEIKAQAARLAALIRSAYDLN